MLAAPFLNEKPGSLAARAALGKTYITICSLESNNTNDYMIVIVVSLCVLKIVFVRFVLYESRSICARSVARRTAIQDDARLDRYIGQQAIGRHCGRHYDCDRDRGLAG